MRVSVLVAVLTALGLAGGQIRAQISDGIVKIGVLSDESGPYATLAGPGSRVAALMAVEDFGAAAKGMRVEVVFADHQNKPDVGVKVAVRWYDAEQVDVIVDVPTSSVALAINQVAREKARALLVSTGASSDLTGKACSPNTVHWTYDTWALANSTGKALVKAGGDTWFFLTADYVFGHSLERDVAAVVLANGGQVLGKVRHPFPSTSDFSSFLRSPESRWRSHHDGVTRRYVAAGGRSRARGEHPHPATKEPSPQGGRRFPSDWLQSFSDGASAPAHDPLR